MSQLVIGSALGSHLGPDECMPFCSVLAGAAVMLMPSRLDSSCPAAAACMLWHMARGKSHPTSTPQECPDQPHDQPHDDEDADDGPCNAAPVQRPDTASLLMCTSVGPSRLEGAQSNQRCTSWLNSHAAAIRELH